MNIKLLIPLASIFVSSCTSDYDEYKERLAGCEADKKESNNYTVNSFDDAINQLDFDAAYSYLSCFEPGYFANEDFEGLKKEHTNSYSPQLQAKQRLADAHVQYLMKENDFESAIQTHEELIGDGKAEDIYGELYSGIAERYQLYRKAVVHFLEEDNKTEAMKWAKRAPRDQSSAGYKNVELENSQYTKLIELVKTY